MSRRSQRGTSLVELLVVVSMLGLLAQAAAPDFRIAFETRRVDEAESVLHSLWNAERMHWLEHGVYTEDLSALVDARLIEPGVLVRTGPFRYTVRQADSHGFSAEAVRIGSDRWSGSLEIDESGEVDGLVVGEGGDRVSPSES
ncbi:MAG: hypothetical protein H6825_16225 [Planctomycetes bacterium]|nr:hypothetical protein [Planctomycetota bacterium]